jgi:hypothetical protein
MSKSCWTVFALIALMGESAAAQQADCYAVAMTNSTNAGNVGSIMINKCTGDSWVLVRTTLGNGAYTLRWFPITVEKNEVIQRGGQ